MIRYLFLNQIIQLLIMKSLILTYLSFISNLYLKGLIIDYRFDIHDPWSHDILDQLKVPLCFFQVKRF